MYTTGWEAYRAGNEKLFYVCSKPKSLLRDGGGFSAAFAALGEQSIPRRRHSTVTSDHETQPQPAVSAL